MKNIYLAIFLFFFKSLFNSNILFANDPDEPEDPENDDDQSSSDVFGAFGLSKKTVEEIAEEEKNAEAGVLVDDPKFKKAIGDNKENDEEVFNEDPDNDETSEDDHVYTINKEQFSRKEIEDKMLEDWGISRKVLDSENLDNLVKDYVAAKNIAVGKAYVDKKHRDNANERKDLNNTRIQLDKEWESLENKESQLQDLEKKISAEKKRLEALTKKEIDEDDPDYYDESKQLDLRLDKREAVKDLKKLEEDERKIQAAKQSIEQDKADNEILYMVSDLQDEFPELELEGDILKLLGQYENGIYNKNTTMAVALITIINDFNNAAVPTKSVTDFYEIHRKRYDGILPDDNTKPITRKTATPEKKKSTIAEKQKQYPREPEGVKFTTSTAKATKSKAQTLRSIGMS